MMSTHNTENTGHFNFEEWLELAQRDPEGFEQRRRAVIESYLNNLPLDKQRRLRGLQFRIDMERQRAHTAMGACIKLSSMMWDALAGPKGLAASIQMLTTARPRTGNPEPLHKAQIMSFRK